MTDAAVAEPPVKDDGKIVCAIDGARVHAIHIHLRDNYPEWTIERYQREYPKHPLMSPLAEAAVKRNMAKKAEEAKAAATVTGEMQPMHAVFGLPADKCRNARGEAITTPVRNLEEIPEEDRIYLADVDPNYVFTIELTKIALIALQLNMPGLLWGYHGTGKSTYWEQVCARTRRPFLRVQHTTNTEEAHVLGQYLVLGGETVFNLGPLPIAMMRGLVYCADEYDVALPGVLSLYQPVLEGKALVIKDAPPEYRIIKPHPNFRFVATGNTNGTGDETGLYQGTQIQNAANYSRFKVTEEVGYLEPDVEAAVVAQQSGARLIEVKKLIKFATEVRKTFANGSIGSTMSPRELISAATIGLIRGGDWRGGLRLAFMNRLSRADKEVCDQFAQRIFG